MGSVTQLATLATFFIASTLAQNILLNFAVTEDYPPDTFVGDVLQASGLGSSLSTEDLSQLEFLLLTEGNQHAAYFVIGEKDGVLRTRQEIDRESSIFCPRQVQCPVELSIIAQGSAGLFRVIDVTVEIRDLNDEIPTFLEQDPAQRSIPENAQVGSSFSIPSAQDLDSPQYGITEYRMSSGSAGTFELKVVDNDLYLVVKREVDRENQDLYQFVIVAIDGGAQPNSGTMNLDVIILDVNDNPPTFERSNYPINIPENFETNKVMVTVKANDQDEGENGELLYGFSSQTSLDYGHLFRIGEVTGEVSLIGTLDFEAQEMYILVVSATEKLAGSIPAEAKVTITVSDINDNAPQTTVNPLSSSGRVEIKENLAPGELAIAYISVQDPDMGAGNQFDCRLSTAEFTLEGSSGSRDFRLFSAVEFNREDNDIVDVDLICTDRGVPRLTSTTTISVFILDENDNAPSFDKESYDITVPENSPEGTELVQLHANDEDSGPNGLVTYQLVSDLIDYVSLDPITGILTARKPFDREQLEELQLLVLAKDQGSPTANSATAIITITIQDTNDEAPKFTVSRYNFSVPENASTGQFVGQISAWDKDLFPNNEFEFTFPNGLQSTEKFAIDNQSGSITTRVTLDREEKDIYHLELLAVDKHNQELRSTVPVVIYVTDVNDHNPVITFPGLHNNTVHIPSDLIVGDPVTQIEAEDPDTGDGATLVYSIRSGNEATTFRIDSASGVISVNRDLSVYGEKLFLLQIRVQDKGSPPKAVESVLNVVVNKSLSRGSSDGGSNSDQNLTIVLCVVIVSLVIILILVVAIVIVCRQEREQKKKKYLAGLLKDTSSSVQSSHGLSDCGSSDAGSSIKKEVSFSNDVEMADEIPYMQRAEQWSEPRSSTSTTRSHPSTSDGHGHHHGSSHLQHQQPSVFLATGMHKIPCNIHNKHFPAPLMEVPDGETTSIESGHTSNTDSGRGSHEGDGVPWSSNGQQQQDHNVHHKTAHTGRAGHYSKQPLSPPTHGPPSNQYRQQQHAQSAGFLELQQEPDDVFYNVNPSVV